MEDVRVKQYTESSCRAASFPTKFNVAKDGEISFQHL